MAYDAIRGETVMFGGNDGVDRLGDTWVWNGESWTQKYPDTSPGPRCCMAMAYDAIRRNIVLFGGCCDEPGGLLDDTWTWDGITWTQEHPPAAPTPRASFGMAYDAGKGRIVIFGGDGGSASPTWTWDGVTWTEEEPVHSPQNVEGPGLTQYGGQVLKFGGEWGCFEDICYERKTLIWNGVDWRKPRQLTRPTDRGYPGIALDTRRNEVVLFGGEYVYVPLDDTWTWDGRRWTRQSPSVSPPGRWSMGTAYDAASHQVVVFGGYGPDDEFLSDTWVWNGTTWRQAA